MMNAFLVAWIVVSSIWTAFCIFDLFGTWIAFRQWRANVMRGRLESEALLAFIDDVRKARETMRGNSGPRDIAPHG